MSFPRYPAYKDSGVEWLGEVPGHWQVKRLKFIAIVQTGVAKGKDNEGKETIEVPYLRVANVQDGYLSLDDVATIEIPYEDLPRYSLRPGDVLMNEGGDFDKLGRGHVWEGEIEPCIHQNHVFAVRPTRISSYWLNAFTGSQAAQFFFMGRSKQSTNLASISSSNVMELPVVVPPDDELSGVLAHLDHETARIDALIEEQQRLIELLKEKRQAVISHAVTKGLDPSVPMKDSGVEWLGEVPAHWEVTKFKWPLRTASGGTPPSNDREAYYDGGIPWLRSLDLTDDLVTEYEVTVTHQAIEETSCKIVPKKSVLIAMYGGDGTIGKNGLLTFDSAINQAICAFLPSDRCSPEYLHRYIQFYRPYWMIGAESSRKDPNIGQDRIGDHFLTLPPLQEQVEIAVFINVELLKFSALIHEAKTGVELLQERRSALISAAVTGKIDLRGWQPPTSAPALIREQETA